MNAIFYAASNDIEDPRKIILELENHFADEYVTGGEVGGDRIIGEWLYENRPCDCKTTGSRRHSHSVLFHSNKRIIDRWWDGKEHVNLIKMPDRTHYRETKRITVLRAKAIENAELHVFPSEPEDSPGASKSGVWLITRMAQRLNLPYFIHFV